MVRNPNFSIARTMVFIECLLICLNKDEQYDQSCVQQLQFQFKNLKDYKLD